MDLRSSNELCKAMKLVLKIYFRDIKQKEKKYSTSKNLFCYSKYELNDNNIW